MLNKSAERSKLFSGGRTAASLRAFGSVNRAIYAPECKNNKKKHEHIKCEKGKTLGII